MLRPRVLPTLRLCKSVLRRLLRAPLLLVARLLPLLQDLVVRHLLPQAQDLVVVRLLLRPLWLLRPPPHQKKPLAGVVVAVAAGAIC